MQNLDLFFIQMSLFINFIRTIFFKMSLCCFTNFLLWNCGLWNAKTNCLKIPPDTCPSASAILNPMNLAPGLVSWFHESGFGFRKSGLNKRHGFWNRFQFWSNQTGPMFQWHRVSVVDTQSGIGKLLTSFSWNILIAKILYSLSKCKSCRLSINNCAVLSILVAEIKWKQMNFTCQNKLVFVFLSCLLSK